MAALGWGQGHICLWAVEARGPWCPDSGELSSAFLSSSLQLRNSAFSRSAHREEERLDLKEDEDCRTFHPLSQHFLKTNINISYNYLYSHKEHLQISAEMFKSEIILCSNSLHTLRKPLKVLWFGFRRAHCAYRAHKAQFSWQCIAHSGSFMPVKWHFSWVHTGSFLPAPVFCESLWTWLCWSRRRNAVGAVSEWSNSAVQFLCQGFPEIFFFFARTDFLHEPGQKLCFFFSLLQSSHWTSQKSTLRGGGDVIGDMNSSPPFWPLVMYSS